MNSPVAHWGSRELRNNLDDLVRDPERPQTCPLKCPMDLMGRIRVWLAAEDGNLVAYGFGGQRIVLPAKSVGEVHTVNAFRAGGFRHGPALLVLDHERRLLLRASGRWETYGELALVCRAAKVSTPTHLVTTLKPRASRRSGGRQPRRNTTPSPAPRYKWCMSDDEGARYVPADDGAAIALAVDGCRVLAAAGQADMVWGHPSVRDPQGRGVWMKCSGWGFEEIDAGRIVLVSPGGEVLSGAGPRHIEYPIHTEIMAARPDVGAVVHTHSPAACQFAALDVALLPLDHAGSLFCYPAIPRFALTGGLIKDQSLGRALAGALGEAIAILLPQHGIVTVGPDLPAAVMTAVLLDRACRTQLGAMAAGPVRAWGPEDDTVAKRADVWAPRQLRAGYEYLLRQASAPRSAPRFNPRPGAPDIRPLGL